MEAFELEAYKKSLRFVVKFVVILKLLLNISSIYKKDDVSKYNKGQMQMGIKTDFHSV